MLVQLAVSYSPSLFDRILRRHFTIVRLALQGLGFFCCRLQCCGQLALGGLGLFLLPSGQLGEKGADGVPQLFQQGLILPVRPDELVQHGPAVHQLARLVRRHLVHGPLPGQGNALDGVVVDAPLHDLRAVFGHGDVTERPVLRGGQLLHPVGGLMAHQKQHRVWVVPLQ